MSTVEQPATIFEPHHIVGELQPQPKAEHLGLVAAVTSAYDHWNDTLVATTWDGYKNLKPAQPATYELTRPIDPYLYSHYVKNVVSQNYGGKTRFLDMNVVAARDDTVENTNADLEVFKRRYLNPFVVMFEARGDHAALDSRQELIRTKVATLILPSLRIMYDQTKTS